MSLVMMCKILNKNDLLEDLESTADRLREIGKVFKFPNFELLLYKVTYYKAEMIFKEIGESFQATVRDTIAEMVTIIEILERILENVMVPNEKQDL